MINNFIISTRLNKITSSGIRRLFHKAQTTPDTISLGLGEPDFNSPPYVLKAAKQALDNGKTHYTSNLGILKLRESISKKMNLSYYGLFTCLSFYKE